MKISFKLFILAGCFKLDMNVGTPAWQAGPTMTTQRSQITLLATDSGKLIVAAGHNAQTSIEIVDVSGPVDGTWEVVANFAGDGINA